jgi:diguanylate cyclase (GGDEF)-like protein
VASVHTREVALPDASDNHPFRRAGLGRRALPFAAVAVIAEASLALPPGPGSNGYTVLSAVLLVVTAGAIILLPWPRLPAWATVLVPVTYAWAVCTLILATGTSASGVGIVILIPLFWSVLFHRRWDSFVVVASIVLVEVVTSLTPVRAADVVLLRRVVFWSLIGILVTVATHGLRDRLRHTLLEREHMLRQTNALAVAATELTVMFNSDDVLFTASRIAAELVSPPGTPGRRAQYTRVIDSMVHVVAQYDEAGESESPDLPLSELPNLQEVMRTGAATNRPIVIEAAGPEVRKRISSLGLTNGVYVPLFANGTIDGVLSVTTRGEKVTPELFEYCKALGHITELALENARAHELLEAQATTDELTGLPNRRAFDQLLARRPGRLPFCILAIDLDGLKHVNDTLGHTAGDEMLVHVSGILAATFRQGDMFARIGGDEFIGLLFDATESDGAEVANRMLAALAAAPSGASPSGVNPAGVSIGIASGGPEDKGQITYAAADAAMYRAKRTGGGRYVVASQSAVTAMTEIAADPGPQEAAAVT